MRIRSHLIVSSCLFAVVVELTQLQWQLTPHLIIGFAAVLIGTLLPDIDHPKSWVGKRVKVLSYPIIIIFGHRGITHSLLMVSALVFAAYSLDNWILYWVTIGYAGHLLGDYLTDSGIPLLYPLKRNYRFVLTGSTGGISEHFMVFLVVIGTVWLVLW